MPPASGGRYCGAVPSHAPGCGRSSGCETRAFGKPDAAPVARPPADASPVVQSGDDPSALPARGWQTTGAICPRSPRESPRHVQSPDWASLQRPPTQDGSGSPTLETSKENELAIAVAYGFANPIQWQVLFLACPSIAEFLNNTKHYLDDVLVLWTWT